MILLIGFVLLALVVSFVCSILESALLSVTPGHVALLEAEQHPVAGRLRTMREDIERPLSAILSLNTIANTIGAAGAGAQAAYIFGSGAVGIFSAGLTLLILIGAEIIPKTLGAVHWKRLTPVVVRVVSVLMVAMFPFVRLARWLAALLTPADREAAVSRGEIAALADEGEREGVVDRGESRVLQNLLRLSGLRVADVMTPREHVVALPDTLPVAEAGTEQATGNFSRVPILADDGAGLRCTGYVLKDEVLLRAARDELDLRAAGGVFRARHGAPSQRCAGTCWP
jgi:CBS domain containing-hemolysin-like protein